MGFSDMCQNVQGAKNSYFVTMYKRFLSSVRFVQTKHKPIFEAVKVLKYIDMPRSDVEFFRNETPFHRLDHQEIIEHS